MGIRAFPMGLPKAKINSNIANKPKKWLPMDELHMRQNGNLLQCQAIYALHCSLGISFFLLFCFLKPHSFPLPLFFLLFYWLWLSKLLSVRRLSLPLISEETLSSSQLPDNANEISSETWPESSLTKKV